MSKNMKGIENYKLNIPPYYKYFLIAGIVAALSAYFYTNSKPATYSVESTYYVDIENVIQSEIAINYEANTNNVKAIVESYDFTGDVIQAAGVSDDLNNRTKVGSALSVKVAAPQVLEIEIAGISNKEELIKLVPAFDKALSKNLELTNNGSGTKLVVKRLGAAPIIRESTANSKLNSVVAFFIVAVFGLSLFESRKYLWKHTN